MISFRKAVGAVLALGCLAAAGREAAAQEASSGFSGSLLFSSRELSAIEAALKLRPPETGQLPGDEGALRQIRENQPAWLVNRLHLSALIFTGPEDWTLWFGAQQVRRGAIPPFLADLRVFASHVDLSVIPRPGARPIPIRLRPNQTFLADQNRIID